MIDRKITPKELADNGLVVDDIEILPPIPLETQSQKRSKREFPYFKLFGRVYYQASDLIKFADANKVNSKLTR